MKNLKELEMCPCKGLAKSYSVLVSIDSTNNYVKEHCDVLPDGHLVIAHEQLGGRGRQGKSFYSPKDSGLYMSLLIKDEKICNDSLFTAKLSLCVCRAIDALTGTNNNNGVGIKWVNDVYFGSKKLCGILCERFTAGDGEKYVVAGIGINMKLDVSKLPKDLRHNVTSIFDITKKEYDKYTLCSNILCEFERVFGENFSDTVALDEYRRRSVVIGREISIVAEDASIRAAALDICDDGSLLVRTEDGCTRKLCGGEITIRVK